MIYFLQQISLNKLWTVMDNICTRIHPERRWKLVSWRLRSRKKKFSRVVPKTTHLHCQWDKQIVYFYYENYWLWPFFIEIINKECQMLTLTSWAKLPADFELASEPQVLAVSLTAFRADWKLLWSSVAPWGFSKIIVRAWVKAPASTPADLPVSVSFV